MGQFSYLIFFLASIITAYFIGSMIERSHYDEIKIKENDYKDLPVVTSKKIIKQDQIIQADLVDASVVISLDYFKRFLAGLRNIVGGRIKSYETLLDRGRREAILRMKEKARALNADIILNMRFETSNIGQVTNKKDKNIGCFEILVYGTALKLKK